MTEDIWGPPHVCPGAEVRQGRSGKQDAGSLVLVGLDEAGLGLCCLAGLCEATGDELGPCRLTCYVFSRRET